MKAVEFQSELTADQTLRVPPAIANGLPRGLPLRVVVLLADNDSDQEWEHFVATEFGQGYADSDAIYDQLLSR